LLKSKDEALHYFKIYKAEVENQLERKIKRLLSDRGGEFFSNDFFEFCAKHSIIHERTPHTPHSPMGFERILVSPRGGVNRRVLKITT
jgi:transposase InsO family protein